MRRFIQRNVEDEAARLIIESYDCPVSAISVDVKDGELRVLAV
jgi:3-hydroxyisobutyrate dehydrogenase-like beta-hydroxyacid dehydrogenase